MNTNLNQWRNRRNQLNLNPMLPFGTIHYSISNYSTDAVKSEMTKTFGDEMLIHNLHMMPNPLQKNLADTIATADKPKVRPQAFTETKMEKQPSHSRSDYYPSLTGISSFFSGVFSALFQRREKSPAPQYYDCFDRADESPPLDWQAAKREDLNKSARAGEQSPVGERGAMSDCGAAVAQCEDKLNRIRLLLSSKPAAVAPKPRRRPRKAFVEPGSVEESFEEAFSPEDFVRIANEPYVECFSPYNHHKEELIEVDAPKIKTECVLAKIEIQNDKETDEVDAKLITTEDNSNTSVAEPREDPKVEVIAACEDKVNKLKELLQRRKPRGSRIEEKSTDSIAEPVLDKEDERACNRTKCMHIDKPQDKHSKKPHGLDKRKKSNILKNIQDDMTFAHEIDDDDVSSPDNSPLVKPTQLCNMIKLCPIVTEVKPNVPEPEHKPDEYFDEVSGCFRSTSTTESEDSFQIVFTDSLKASRARNVSDCDSEDSFIVFEDSPDSCYTSHDVFGEQSDSEATDDDSDTESDVSDSGCGVSCKLSGTFSRTVGDLTDDSLFDDTVRQDSDSEDEVDSAVRTMCEEIPEQDLETEVVMQKSTGLLIDDAKKLLRRQQPPKKVRFSEKPPQVRVMRVWAFAARAARAGHWERHALDRDRFRRKIADVDMAVSWVLKPQHRKRVMFQRFMPWWNAQRRKEIAEKKQREEEERAKEEDRKRVEEERKAGELADLKQQDAEDEVRGVDGDSEVMYHTMIGQICEKYGKTYSKDNAVKIYGMTDREVSEEVCARARLPLSVDEFERQLLDLARNKLPNAPEKPGADRLLTHLFDYKVPMALATNSTEQSVRLVSIARPKLFAMFHHKVSFSDPEVDRGKPHPDIYLVAASRFPDKPKPAQCIVFEDSEVGVQAAVAAGMQVVMVPDPRLDRERTRQATLVLRSLRDFKPELFGLPPFSDASPSTTVPIHHS